MEIVGPVIDLINHVWNCSGKHTSYLRNLKENLDSLRDAMVELRNLRDEVKGRVEVAEAQQMVQRPVVGGWLQRVDTIEGEVREMREEGSKQIEERCLGGCCPKNCWTSYKLGKRVVKKLATINEVISKGKFDEVADRSRVVSVQAWPENPTVGTELMFEKAMKLLQDDKVRIMGFYGMGGVGKTTLLKKINNEISGFDVVIWVVVSKELNLGRIQKHIGKRLGLPWEEDEVLEAGAQTIFNNLSHKKFLLLLDDCWDRVDLEKLGIPHPCQTRNKGGKVVFTTRSLDVCGKMDADKKIKVECLDHDQACKLFEEKVGEEALNSHPEIQKLAKEIASECCGLPLALITVGRTMASKKTPKEWRHALTVLRKYASDFSGIEDGVFSLLKYSYDNLKDDTLKSCFLYCSLYPEDFNILIDDLIMHWIGEGFLDGVDNMNEAYEKGCDMIGCLKAACLLESGENIDEQVKMHDVIRDLAIWIGCESGTKKGKFFVRAGVNLSETPAIGCWKETERLSLMDNKIKSLKGAHSSSCTNLLTLFLQWNFSLHDISDDFFQFMPVLKVLNLSCTKITCLPTSISAHLVELQYLNLSKTFIEELPAEFKNLVKLKYLDLSYTKNLNTIPAGMISCLVNLKLLNLYCSKFPNWNIGSCDNDVAGGASLMELECSELERLEHLSLMELERLKHLDTLGGASLMELECLEHLDTLGVSLILTDVLLQKLLNSNKLQRCMNFLKISLPPSSSLFLEISLPPSSSLSSSSVITSLCIGSMKNLQELGIENCLLEELIINWEGVEDENWLLPRLKTLTLESLPKLTITWKKGLNYSYFQNLSYVNILGCHALVDLTWLLFAPNLQDLCVYDCKEVTTILDLVVETITPPFARLEKLYLHDLPKLASIISERALPFPALVIMVVRNCPKLKKLPFDSNTSAQGTLKFLEGSREWWDELQWEDQTVRSSFLPYFSEW